MRRPKRRTRCRQGGSERLVFLTSCLRVLDQGSTTIDLTSDQGTANGPSWNRPDPVALFGECASQGSTKNTASEASFQTGIVVLSSRVYDDGFSA